MMSRQYVVTGDNLSYVWTVVFLEAWQPGNTDMAPLIVTVTGLGEEDGPSEDDTIRRAMDDSLLSLGTGLSVNMVANTIFPDSQWNRNRPRQELFDRFRKTWPRIRDYRDSHGRQPNKNGTYFQRLSALSLDINSKPINLDNDSKLINQLDQIVNAWDGGLRRRSAFQAVVFDPRTDHKRTPYLRFPCLHQVAFTQIGRGEMCVTGFYGLQYLFERAYGNYLGLCRLGRFMAQEMGLKLTRMTCVASAATLASDKFRKRDLATLARVVQNAVPSGVMVGQNGAGCSQGSPVQAMRMS